MATIEQPTVQTKPQKSWFGRNWWWVLLLIILGCGVVCCGIGTLVYYKVSDVIGHVRESEAYKMTFKEVCKDPTVLEKLGEPIEDPLFVGGMVTENEANIAFPVNGPKGAAAVEAQGRKVDGKWTLIQVSVQFEEGEKHFLKLGEDTSGSLDDAPPFNPGGETP